MQDLPRLCAREPRRLPPVREVRRGAHGDRPTAREERKVVTVLFADLVGFTAAREQLDPEDVRAHARAVPRAAARPSSSATAAPSRSSSATP